EPTVCRLWMTGNERFHGLRSTQRGSDEARVEVLSRCLLRACRRVCAGTVSRQTRQTPCTCAVTGKVGEGWALLRRGADGFDGCTMSNQGGHPDIRPDGPPVVHLPQFDCPRQMPGSILGPRRPNPVSALGHLPA